MSATLDFDTGPLNWVRGDIEAALKGAAERVRAYGADPSLENALRLARDEVHGATGALRMVGLEGAGKVTAALEDALTAMDGKSIAADELNTKALLDALEALLKWVVRMAEGRGEGELALFPTYRRLRELAGVEKIFEGELFYPDLRIRVGAEAGPGVSEEELPQRVKTARAQFQRGLLAFLRGNKAEAGLAAMARSLAEVESCVTSQAARAFWWSCKGFVDALLNKGVEPDFHVKQLLARIDLQMRQLIEGSPQVTEHLMRDALFFIAKSKSMGEDSEAVRSAFGLDKYLPRQQMDAEQMARTRPVLRLLKETLTDARNQWNGFSEGKQEALPAFQAAVGHLSTQAGALGVPALGELISAVAETSATADSLSGDVLAGVQLEIATTLLFLQNAVDSEDILDPDFQSRAQNQLRRLAAARAGHAEESAADLMDEGSRKAAEHALLDQLGKEIRSSLQQMEDALDAFFRDAEARDGLSSLDILAAQVQGALAILEQAEAGQLLSSTMEAIRPYVISGIPGDEDKERIADALSSLGLFIEAHCAGREDAKRILRQPMAEFGLAEALPSAGEDDDFFVSEAAPTASETEPALITPALAESLDEAANTSEPALELQWQAPEPPAFEPPAVAEVQTIEMSAPVAEEVDESLLGLESYAEWQARTQQEETAPAVDVAASAEAPVAAEAESPAPPPAAPSSAPEIDPELLEIFLEEADEVLANMAASTDACEDNADDRENLTVVRRAFHTLKGSGRMVGLTDFGEVAWGMEQLMNGWLAAEKPASAPLIAVVRRAHDLFEGWVASLRENSAASVDASALLAEAARVAHGSQEAATEEAFPQETIAESVADLEALGDIAAATLQAVTLEQAQAAIEPPPAASEVEPVQLPAETPEEIQIGTVRLSPALYDIFKTESANWAKILDDEIERLSENGHAVVSDIARRGVHTLAGIAGTTGFVQLANLALAVESYFRKLDGRPVPKPALGTVLDALTRINSMIENIHSRVVPLQAAPLIYALNQMPAESEISPPQDLSAEAEIEIGGVAPDAALEAGSLAELDIQAIEAAPTEAGAEAEISADLPEAAIGVGEAGIETEAFEAAPIEAETPAAEMEIAAVLENASEEIELEGIVAQARPQAAPVFEERDIQDEIDPVLLPIFLEEAETLVPEAAQALRSWMAAPNETEGPSALRRVLHTVKGSARMAGAMRLGELTHIMESRVISVLDGQSVADAAMLEKLEEEFDHLAAAVDRLKYGTPEPVEIRHVETEVADADVLVPSIAESPEADQPAAPVQSQQPATAPPVQAQAGAAAESQHRESATLRVRADWVDRMVNQAGEVAIARSRIESQMYALKRQTTELSEALRRLKDHLREVEIQAESQMQATFQSQAEKEQFDPLEFDRFTRFQEVTRFLAESVHDIFTVQQTLTTQLGEADAALLQQARMNRELQQNLMRVRMVPLYSVSERLYRVVRQAARDLDKRAQLDIQGGDIEIDRGVLEKIVAPIEHLLRNAIAHGLEAPGERAQAGKSEYGEIRLSAKHEGNEMVLTVSDDGRGLDLQRIHQKAIERGLLDPGVEPGNTQLAQMIFVAGFSTADEVTQIAGRGVGMDVVKNEIAGLGGRIEIATEAGKGVSFIIYLPLTLAVTQAVIITADKNEYALPATLVQQVQELKPEQLAAALQARAIEWRGNSYPLFYLPHLLGQSDALHEVQRFNSIVLMKSGTSYAAVLVDTVEGTREIVVKNIGPQVSRVTGIAGATVRGDGKVVLILNPVPLAIRVLNLPVEAIQIIAPQASTITVEETEQVPLIMVVDDSLTVRKITSRLMSREGYRVETAKDGVDALEKMHDILPDVVLLDVEMPRMDGFELARVMRNDARLKSVPIIMITSRTADKHRNHALEIGVNVYLGKPFQEAVLLSHIADLLGERALISV
ncbi:response regulator [Betaproteobacteria bacterium SCN2]|jgi:chemosensory pili system protein ChpA (sensor histidine kinase/response regulator)|nr:response regulator [Betaproteobacteria bacterium SCN2]